MTMSRFKSPFRIHWKLYGKLVVPCDDFVEWAIWFETADRIVAKTQVGPAEVSTVFIGLDYNFLALDDDTYEPLVFETMVFDADPLDDSLTVRYSTWDDAEKGHALAVAWAEALVQKVGTIECPSLPKPSTVTSSGTLKS
jgi:hypothetical protein